MHRFIWLSLLMLLLLPTAANSEYVDNSCYSWGGNEWYSNCNPPYVTFYYNSDNDHSGWQWVEVGGDAYIIWVAIYHAYSFGEISWECENGTPARYFLSQQCVYGSSSGFENWDACNGTARKNILYCDVPNPGDIVVYPNNGTPQQFADNIDTWLDDTPTAVLIPHNGAYPSLPYPWNFDDFGPYAQYAKRPMGTPYPDCP